MRKNLSNMIVKSLPAPVLRIIEAAGTAASRSNEKLYLVGGIVRDLLLGRESRDVDILAEHDAIAIAEAMAASLSVKPIVHATFGTVTFELDSCRIDLATCRSETYDQPGALPKVSPGSIKQDLFRRDFTINAMAVCINLENFGQVIDLYNGQRDLASGLIRVIHDDSFTDDATRIMRAVRYGQRLDFKLERKTARLLRRDLGMLDTISGDRLRHELVLWLNELQPEKIIKSADGLGILVKIHPALSWNAALSRAFRSAAKTSRLFPLVPLYFALLIYQMDKQQLAQLLKRLNITGGELRQIAMQTVSLKDSQVLLDETHLKPSNIYVKLKPFHPVAIRANDLLAPAKDVRTNLRLYLDKLRFVKTRVTGKDLSDMGIPEGRKMGIILDRLLTARLDGEVSTKKDEEKLAKQWVEAL